MTQENQDFAHFVNLSLLKFLSLVISIQCNLKKIETLKFLNVILTSLT
jgi:hypothetical protein